MSSCSTFTDGTGVVFQGNANCANASDGFGMKYGNGGGPGVGLPNGADFCNACPSGPAPCPGEICSLSLAAQIVCAIVNIGVPQGANASEIAAYINGECPEGLVTEAQVDTALRQGRSRGVFCPTSTSPGAVDPILAEGRFKVNGGFAAMPSNLLLAQELGPRHQICMNMYN